MSHHPHHKDNATYFLLCFFRIVKDQNARASQPGLSWDKPNRQYRHQETRPLETALTIDLADSRYARFRILRTPHTLFTHPLHTPCSTRQLALNPGTGDGGGERDRTDDPLLAKQVLSQLSYTPSGTPQASDSHPSIPGGSGWIRTNDPRLIKTVL